MCAKCWLRPIDEADSVYWPAMEIAITVDVSNFETEAGYIDDVISFGNSYFNRDWQFRVVPVINGLVVPHLAIFPASHAPLPDRDFARDWSVHIDIPFLSSRLMENFDRGLDSCIQISTILACRNVEQLHPDEENAISVAVETFKEARGVIFEAAEASNHEHILLAYDYLNKYWSQVLAEFEALKDGEPLEHILCMGPHLALSGNSDDQTNEIAAVRILLLQDECMIA